MSSKMSQESIVLKQEGKAPIHKVLSYLEIEELRQFFKSSANGKLTNVELREVLSKFNVIFDDDDYVNFWAKINSRNDNECQWDDVLSYLIIGYHHNDHANHKEALDLPICEVPVVKRCGHKHPVISIVFNPTISGDGLINNSQGTFITTSKDGTINILSNNFEVKRSGKSRNPNLKYSQTHILATVSLSDARIICTSSIECDLRFYDIAATSFHLRMIVTNFPYAISCMSYYMPQNLAASGRKLLAGDFNGNIYLIDFVSNLRQYFQKIIGTAIIQLTWLDLIKGKCECIFVQQFPLTHNDKVRQIMYSNQLGTIFSSAECHKSFNLTDLCAGVVGNDIGNKGHRIMFLVPKGVTCFDIDDKTDTLVTGGPDTILRVWNTLVPEKPIAILGGHHAGIVFVFIQRSDNLAYSLDHHKDLKVWKLEEQTILQTYSELCIYLPYRIPFCCHYNDETHELVVASRKLVSIKCYPLVEHDFTDGETHLKPITVILYNNLFKSIVTCGEDSNIIIWDPWTGKRLSLIKQAHTRKFQGEKLMVEITAACFNQTKLLLLTGASDGSLKVWDFNIKTCIRNLSIKSPLEITAVYWLEDRILAAGWNRRIVEFSDISGEECSEGNPWAVQHSDDISSITVNEQCIATGSFSGELILWKLETGQPYRKYHVNNPTKEVRLTYDLKQNQEGFNLQNNTQEYTFEPKLSNSVTQSGNNFIRPLSIRAILFLQTRPLTKEHGNLLVAVENGKIQVFSHLPLGGFIEEFLAVHTSKDYVVAMATDKNNEYLFTATALGYIKIWLMTNFCIPSNDFVKVSLPQLRLKFPFLLKDQLLGRAKRSVRHQQNPMLLNSFQGHIRIITSLAFIDQSEIIASGSKDLCVRLWTLGGRYLGTFGSSKSWPKLSSVNPVSEVGDYRIPPDIEKVASSTTLKVLTAGATKQSRIKFKAETTYDDDDSKSDNSRNKDFYGVSLRDPLLGKHFKLPPHGKTFLKPILDTSLPYIPVYSHLEIHPIKQIERPKTPEIIKRLRNPDLMG